MATYWARPQNSQGTPVPAAGAVRAGGLLLTALPRAALTPYCAGAVRAFRGLPTSCSVQRAAAYVGPPIRAAVGQNSKSPYFQMCVSAWDPSRRPEPIAYNVERDQQPGNGLASTATFGVWAQHQQ